LHGAFHQEKPHIAEAGPDTVIVKPLLSRGIKTRALTPGRSAIKREHNS